MAGIMRMRTMNRITRVGTIINTHPAMLVSSKGFWPERIILTMLVTLQAVALLRNPIQTTHQALIPIIIAVM